MSGWTYYGSNSAHFAPADVLTPGARIATTLGQMETVGQREMQLLIRARKSRSGLLATDSGRAGNAERLAARRLTLREKPLLRRCEIRGTEGARTTIWTLTERGRTCWLRVKS